VSYNYDIIKKQLDFSVALMGFILLSPLFVIIAFMTKINSSDPIFFRHLRLGKKGEIFPLIKFRTMKSYSDEFLSNFPEYSQEIEENYKIKNDPRITKLGKLLRKYSLDELPQLINVLKGEMSVVGPRPIVESEIVKYREFQDKLLEVKPGITGLWQVSGRNDLPYNERVKLDVKYIENRSLWLDIKIILKTIPAVISAKGAY